MQKLVNWLETRIKKLELVIQKLKAELKTITSQTLWSKTKQLIYGKEKDLNQLQNSRTILNSIIVPNNNNSLPIIPIVSVISIVSLLGLITYKVKKNKIKK